MKRNHLFSKLLILLALALIMSTKIFSAIHLTGSLEFHASSLYMIPRTIVKQRLIERKGLMWFLNHHSLGEVFLLDDGTSSGLFIVNADSEALYEIKEIIDELSEENDTFCIDYAQADTYGSPRLFSIDRFTNEEKYRDSINAMISAWYTFLAKGYDSFKNQSLHYWFLADSSLYHNADCMRFYSSDGKDRDVIENFWVELEYKAACKEKGYIPLTDGLQLAVPCSLLTDEAIDNPEIQLLYKYMKKSDSIILNTPLPENIYDLNFQYDHRNVNHKEPFIFRKKRRDYRELIQEKTKKIQGKSYK